MWPGPSEVLAPIPSPVVEYWLAAQSPASGFTTTVTKAESLYGIGILPEGKRKQGLTATIGAIFSEDFARRVLAFDEAASDHYARIAAHRRHIDRPISQFDAQIAAIAASRGADLATRNDPDFEDTGIKIIDPWIGGAVRGA